eukprot:1180300-Prorocentrum_minimum.AAC.4
MGPGVLPSIGGGGGPSTGAPPPPSGAPPGAPGDGFSFPMGPGNTPFNFKTKVCNKWQTGTCPFGSKCHFAHGQQELRQRQPLPGGDVPGAPEGCVR